MNKIIISFLICISFGFSVYYGGYYRSYRPSTTTFRSSGSYSSKPAYTTYNKTTYNSATKVTTKSTHYVSTKNNKEIPMINYNTYIIPWYWFFYRPVIINTDEKMISKEREWNKDGIIALIAIIILIWFIIMFIQINKN